MTITINTGSGNYVDSFPYANKTNADCGIAAIRTAETILTGNPARSRDTIIGLLNEPAGKFEDGGRGMTRPNTNFNAALNPIGFSAVNTQIRNADHFAQVVSQGNLMAIATQSSLQGHMIIVQPIAPTFTNVRVYNNGPRTSSGNASVQIMTVEQAASLPYPRSSSGSTGQVWTITPTLQQTK